MVRNKALVLRQTPTEYPVPGQDLVVVVGSFNLREGPPPGGLTVKTIYASLDPYHRACMSETGLLPLMYPLKVGRPLASISIAKVLISLNKRFKSGDIITGLLAIQEYSIIKPEWIEFYVSVFNPHGIELPTFLGALGMSGLTAYVSIREIVRSRMNGSKKNEIIFISSAAGAVGHFAGQLAKEEGLSVIGSVGTNEKLDYIVTELKFVSGFNYNTEKPIDALRRLAPSGIDIYFDNVGGEQLDAALEVMNENGHILCCGMISDYNKSLDEKYRVKNLINIGSKRLRIQGFSITDHVEQFYKFYPDLALVFATGLNYGFIKTRNHVIYGIDNGPEGFVAMLKGRHIGNTVLQISNE